MNFYNYKKPFKLPFLYRILVLLLLLVRFGCLFRRMHHLVCSRDGLVSECREYFPRRFQVEFAEFLRHLRRLVHDSTQFGVVAHLSISYCQLDDALRRFAVRITNSHFSKVWLQECIELMEIPQCIQWEGSPSWRDGPQSRNPSECGACLDGCWTTRRTYRTLRVRTWTAQK